MKSLRLFIYLLLAVCLNGCRENHAMPLFNHDSLQDNIVFYLESLQDIQNVVCNPTTTFVNIFTRNDSLIVIIDSEPEKDRIVIPGINCSEAEVFCRTGYYLNRIVSIFCEPEYCYLVNLSSLGHIPLNEKRRLSKMRSSNKSFIESTSFPATNYISLIVRTRKVSIRCIMETILNKMQLALL